VRYKFGRARAAAELLANNLHETLPYFGPDVVVGYVPTATRRLRQRGYDQAELIARGFAKRRGLSCRRIVTRLSQTRQVGATKKQRQTQLRAAFVVTHAASCENKTVLIVDDVVTTGATLEAVASVLRAAGAKHVDAAVFAQKV